jgi:hypothetical protein
MTTNSTIDCVPLLPCPFCGKNARYVPADYVDHHGQPWPFAECNPCNVGAPVEFWNKRAAQPQGELLRDALDHIARTCHQSRTQSRRIRWIEARANGALDGKAYDPKALDLPIQVDREIERLKRRDDRHLARIKDLEARIAELEQARGESAAWVECSPAWLNAGGDCATAPRLCIGRDGISHLHPVCAEQTAPVAVVLP